MVRIGVRDFGPIKEGSATLKPLTVLIGPNNTGKSYFALLAYAAISPFERPTAEAAVLRGVPFALFRLLTTSSGSDKRQPIPFDELSTIVRDRLLKSANDHRTWLQG